MKGPVGFKSLSWVSPERRLGNDEPPFCDIEEIPKNWFRFWGIERRPWMDPATTTGESLGVAACKAALEAADMEADEIDLVLTSCSSPLMQDTDDAGLPSTERPPRMAPRYAAIFADAVGAKNAMTWNIEMQCLSFLVLLQSAANMIRSGAYRRVLIASVETMSVAMDYSERSCTTFADSAAAAVLTDEDLGSDLISSAYQSNGDFFDIATMKWRWPTAKKDQTNEDFRLYFSLVPNERERMMDFVPNTVPVMVPRVLKEGGVGVDQVKRFIFHQPGKTLIDTWANGIAQSMDSDLDGRYPMTLTDNGCLVAIAIPSTLLMTAEKGDLDPGDYVVMAGLGTGWCYGAQLWRWGDTKVKRLTV